MAITTNEQVEEYLELQSLKRKLEVTLNSVEKQTVIDGRYVYDLLPTNTWAEIHTQMAEALQERLDATNRLIEGMLA